MKIRYFQDTDTLYIEFRPASVAETQDLDEDTLLDLARRVRSVALPWSMLTIEWRTFHTSPSNRSRSDQKTFSRTHGLMHRKRLTMRRSFNAVLIR
jgi:hypothetical protein